MTPTNETYHIEEYRAVRSEIMFFIREIALFEKAAIVAVAGIYIFLAGEAGLNVDPTLVQFAWWLPTIVIVAVMRKTEDYIRRIRVLADYLEKMQGHLACPELGGWETYVRSNESITKRNRSSDITGRVIWFSVLIISVVLAAKYGWWPSR
jgi:hypothetical protein